MKNILLIIIISIFFFNIASADLGVFKQGECISLYQLCDTCSYVNITSIQFPNSTITYINEAMGKNGVDYNYTFCNTSQLGEYSYKVCGDKNTFSCEVIDFEITYLGKTLSSAKAMMSIGFLSLLILIFFLNFVAMGFLPKRNQADEEGRILSITYLKYFRNVLWMTGYFLFIGIVYIASNLAYGFLDEVLLANTLFMIFRVAFGLAPVVVIVWLIWIFASMFHDKEFQKMLNRGIFPGGNL